MEENKSPLEERYSHLIYFFADTKEDAERIVSELKTSFDTELYQIRKTKHKNYKVKITANKNDVCEMACALTQEKRVIFVYDWKELANKAKGSTEYRKRFYRDFRYICTKLKDDEEKTYEDIAKMIDDKEIFDNEILKSTVEHLNAFILEPDRIKMAYSVLDKLFKVNKKIDTEEKADEQKTDTLL